MGEGRTDVPTVAIERRATLPRDLVWHVAVVSVLVIGVRLLNGPLIIDDAYITFRYARNLASGLGWVFNPGEAVMGSSSPLMVGLLAAAGVARLPIPTFAFALGIASAVAIAVMLLFLGRRLAGPIVGLIAAIAFALAPKAVLPSVSGMETPVFTALALGTFTLLAFDHLTAAAFVAGLAAVTRPEGVAVAFVLLGAFLVLRRKIGIEHLLLMFAPLVGWLVFSQIQFGSWIPQSVMAKAAVYPPFENPSQDALIIINYLTNPLQGFPEAPVVGLPNLVFAIALALGALHAFRHLEVIGAPLVWTAGLGLGYSVLNRYLFPWYLAPLFPMSLLLVTIGGVGILKASSVHWRPGFRRLYRLTAGAVCIAVAVGLGIEMLGAGLATKRDLAIREDGYARSGGWIGSHFGYGAEVAAVEVGALGYAYPGPILDLTGLVTPASLPYYSAAKFSFSFPHDVPPELVTELQPPVLVVFDGFIESLLATSAFRTSYCLVYSEPRTHHAYGRLLIFIRPAAFQGSMPLCQGMTPSIEPDEPWGQA